MMVYASIRIRSLFFRYALALACVFFVVGTGCEEKGGRLRFDSQVNPQGDGDVHADTDVDDDLDRGAETESGSNGAGGSNSYTRPDYSDPQAGPLARGLDISEIALYQGLKIPIMKDRNPVESRPVPVVAGRDAMLRVYVKCQSSWQDRTVRARVDFNTDAAQAVKVERFVSGDSLERDLDSTFNLNIPGEYLTPDVRIQVTLREVSDEDVWTGSSASALWPPGGHAVKPESSGELEVVIIPIRYNYDGSGREPDVSEGTIKAYLDALYVKYPVSNVKITVAEPLDWALEVLPDGTGWAQLLNRVQICGATGAPERNNTISGCLPPGCRLTRFVFSGAWPD